MVNDLVFFLMIQEYQNLEFTVLFKKQSRRICKNIKLTNTTNSDLPKLCIILVFLNFSLKIFLSNISLELNLKELHGIDFKKGCFVGQENTARMNLKEKIRRDCFRFKY